jgi:hypothetical protein
MICAMPLKPSLHFLHVNGVRFHPLDFGMRVGGLQLCYVLGRRQYFFQDNEPQLR